MENIKNIKYVVFSGGGLRCIWQAGFWEVLSSKLSLKPEIISCVSAGASAAGMCFSNTIEKGMKHLIEMTSNNTKNLYYKNFFSKSQVMPHYSLYKEAINYIIDEKAFNKLKHGPDFRISITRPPRWLGARSATFVGFSTYSLEKKIYQPVHPVWGPKLGFKPEIVSLKDCSSVEEFSQLLLCSSCTPPFVPILKWNNEVSLDGGLVDNVPVHAIKERDGNMLVMLTRKYPEDKIPKIRGRIYVQPSRPLSITKWDYTNSDGIQDAFDLGRRDAESFLKK